MVVAKAPVPGRVKTRLCPPCTPNGAAAVAAAALADTIAAVGATPATARTLVVAGRHPAPPGWRTVEQRGDGFGDRLAHAFADAAVAGAANLLIGMDTPQVTPGLLAAAATALTSADADAVLGPAYDGGWWALGLREPGHADVLRTVPMSTDHTGADTLAALRARGLRVAVLPVLRDVDTPDDAYEVARLCRPDSRFAAAVRAVLPECVAR
jgi:rSAM/selenodomain-associated transferase 1